MITQFEYSPTRRFLTKITTTLANSTKILENTYTRDVLGRITAIAGLTPNDSWTYVYDDLDRLQTATNLGDPALTETFTYSPSGNLLTRSRLTDGFVYPAGTGIRPHAPIALGARLITYDANGNMTDDDERLLSWDEANRLAQVTMPSGDVVGLTYGPDGSRAKKASLTSTSLYASKEAEIKIAGAVTTHTRHPHLNIKIKNGTAQFTPNFTIGVIISPPSAL